VVWIHALRNSLIPLITVVGVQTGYLLGGAIVTEEVFTLPGIGRLVLWAVFQRDYPLVQGTILFISVLFMLSNLAVDLIYGTVDPRIRHG
jgi:peptide/nickel transport system permease protein